MKESSIRGEERGRKRNDCETKATFWREAAERGIEFVRKIPETNNSGLTDEAEGDKAGEGRELQFYWNIDTSNTSVWGREGKKRLKTYRIVGKADSSG